MSSHVEGYPVPDWETFPRVAEINKLAKELAGSGETIVSKRYFDDFFDVNFLSSDIRGERGHPELDDMDILKSTHDVLIIMRDGTIHFSVMDDGRIKAEKILDNYTEEDINNRVSADELGFNLLTDSQARLYGRIFKMMADAGVGTDPSFSYQNQSFFRQFESAVVDMLDNRTDVEDGPDPINQHTITDIKESIDKITSRQSEIMTASKWMELPDDADKAHTNRVLVVDSVVSKDITLDYVTTEIEYSYRPDDQKRVQITLKIGADGNCSYNKAVTLTQDIVIGDDEADESSIPVDQIVNDAQQYLEAIKRYKAKRQQGIDSPTTEQLEAFLNVLMEASEL